MPRRKLSDDDYLDTGEPILRTKGLDWPPHDLCIRFVNTADVRHEPSRHQRSSLGLVTRPLDDYDAIVRWLGQMKALSDVQTRALLKLAEESPKDAAAAATALNKARKLFGRVANAFADNRSPERADLQAVRDLVNECWEPLSFEVEADGAGVWMSPLAEPSLDAPRRQIVFSMALLMSSRARFRVRRCADAECTLLFLDGVKGPKRIWCHNAVCGMKNKKRRDGS